MTTVMGLSMVLRFRDFEEEKLRSPACSRLENAIFSPHFHRTWEPYFSPPLYMENRNPHPSGNWARRDRGRNKGCVESWAGFKEEAGNTKIAECEGGYD